jgi:monothiol glutaredoxin
VHAGRTRNSRNGGRFQDRREALDWRLPEEQSMDAKEFIQKTVTENPIVLFMKGTAQFPMCGFSGRAIALLKNAGAANVVTVNVLDDDEIREGVKQYANWPTIPQLYVNGEFVGGSDIMAEMAESGELQTLIRSVGAKA